MAGAANIFFAVGGAVLGSALTVVVLRNTVETSSATNNDGGGDIESSPSRLADTQDLAAEAGVAVAAAPPVVVNKQYERLSFNHAAKQDLLSAIIAPLWEYINQTGCTIIRETVELSFKELSAPLSSLRFDKLDLGRTPLRFDNIVVREIRNGVLQFDLDVIWESDCVISLTADYLGSFGVKKIHFKGRMAFILKPLMNVAPVAGAVQYCFIDTPYLKLDFTGLAKLADLKSINDVIVKTIQDNLADMVVAPNRMMTKLDITASYFDIYQPPIGIARITLLRGEGFPIEKLMFGGEDIPDVYCNISFGASPVWKTSVVNNSTAPVWENEFEDFLLSDYGQTIVVHAWDYDNRLMDSDDDLGSASVTVQQLLLAASDRTMTLALRDKEEKPTGSSITIRYDLFSLTSTSFSSLTQVSSPHVIGGLVTIIVNRAFDIPLKKEEACCKVKVKYGDSHVFETAPVVDALGIDPLNPFYERVFYVLLRTDTFQKKGGQDVVFELLQGIKEESLGKIVIRYSDLVEAPHYTIREKRRIGTGGASLEYRVSLEGVQHGDAIQSVKSATTPVAETPVEAIAAPEQSTKTILPEGSTSAPTPAPTPEPTPQVGVSPSNTPSTVSSRAVAPSSAAVAPVSDTGSVRITAVCGNHFPIQRRPLRKADIPDVYLKIKLASNPTIWTTSVIDNNTDPVWNESSTFSTSDMNDLIHVDAFDRDTGKWDRDDKLGSVEVRVADLLSSGGTMELQLIRKGKLTGASITLRCEKVA